MLGIYVVMHNYLFGNVSSAVIVVKPTLERTMWSFVSISCNSVYCWEMCAIKSTLLTCGVVIVNVAYGILCLIANFR